MARRLMLVSSRRGCSFAPVDRGLRHGAAFETLESRTLLSADADLVHVLWAPDTPQAVVDAAELESGHSFAAAGDPNAGLFIDSNRWSRTATNGSGLRQGDPTIITWSIVPDGTPISGYNGEPSAASDLRARLDTLYGSIDVWLPVFEQVFDRWSEVSGVTYVYEANDDGVSIGYSNRGVLDVRGDVRIGGHYIDGNGGVLAYNFYPNSGDMVIDTADNYYDNKSNDSRRMRNILAHEAGHGLGMQHTSPVNRTKLLEPYLTTSFDGPQFNDILSVQRGYGDALEGIDSINDAFSLGSLLNEGTRVETVSIDDVSDMDYYSFSITQASVADVVLTPIGPTYSLGEQGGSTSTFDAASQSNLALSLIGPDGVTVIMDVNDGDYGESEQLTMVLLQTPGTYFLKVTGDTGFAQMYELDVSVAEPAPTNASPIAADDAYATVEGDTLVVSTANGVLGNDTDADGDPLFVSLLSGPANAQSFNLNTDGSFNYTPTADFVGIDMFTYLVQDDFGESDTASVMITVNAAPDPPAVLDVTINNGAAQRSTVTALTLVFDQDVIVTANNLQVWNVDTDTLLDSHMINLNYDAQTFTATFTFDGLMGASLDDGNYEIRLVADPSAFALGQTLASESEFVLQVHRLFGDIDGDRDVDAADLFQFRQAYVTQQGESLYNPFVDYDRDGDIDAADLFQFRLRYQSQLEPIALPITGPTATSNLDSVLESVAQRASASTINEAAVDATTEKSASEAIRSQASVSLLIMSHLLKADARRTLSKDASASPWNSIEPLAQLWLRAFQG